MKIIKGKDIKKNQKVRRLKQILQKEKLKTKTRMMTLLQQMIQMNPNSLKLQILTSKNPTKLNNNNKFRIKQNKKTLKLIQLSK